MGTCANISKDIKREVIPQVKTVSIATMALSISSLLIVSLCIILSFLMRGNVVKQFLSPVVYIVAAVCCVALSVASFVIHKKVVNKKLKTAYASRIQERINGLSKKLSNLNLKSLSTSETIKLQNSASNAAAMTNTWDKE